MQEPHPQRIEWLLEFLRKDIAFDGVGRVVTFTPLEMRHLCTNVEWYLLGPKAELDESDKVRLTGAPNSFERGREVLSASDLEREIWRGQVLARLQSAVLAGMKTLEAGEAWRASEVARQRSDDRPTRRLGARTPAKRDRGTPLRECAH